MLHFVLISCLFLLFINWTTDCGGLVSGPGGAITMMNMSENNTDVRSFDCIWIIKPGNNYMMMKTHISLRIEEFHGMASRSDLTIRQGTTSDALEIENLEWPNNGVSKETHVVPVLTGYYIRLKGVFGMSSKLAIVYSVFNYLSKFCQRLGVLVTLELVFRLLYWFGVSMWQ